MQNNFFLSPTLYLLYDWILFVITSKLSGLDFHIETKMVILSNLQDAEPKPHKKPSCLTLVILVVKIQI